MKEQDLKRCFSKIKPSERLVNDTIRRIDEAERAESTRPAFRFSYRLASAVCALVIVLGLGVAVLYNPTMIPKAQDAESASPMSLASGRTADDDQAVQDVAAADTAVLARMNAAAAAEGGEHAVFFGSLDGCYFGGVTPEDAERGVMYRCTLTFTVSAGESVQADVYVYDSDTMDMILGSTAGYVYVRLSDADGEWVVEELIPHTEK